MNSVNKDLNSSLQNFLNSFKSNDITAQVLDAIKGKTSVLAEKVSLTQQQVAQAISQNEGLVQTQINTTLQTLQQQADFTTAEANKIYSAISTQITSNLEDLISNIAGAFNNVADTIGNFIDVAENIFDAVVDKTEEIANRAATTIDKILIYMNTHKEQIKKLFYSFVSFVKEQAIEIAKLYTKKIVEKAEAALNAKIDQGASAVFSAVTSKLDPQEAQKARDELESAYRYVKQWAFAQLRTFGFSLDKNILALIWTITILLLYFFFLFVGFETFTNGAEDAGLTVFKSALSGLVALILNRSGKSDDDKNIFTRLGITSLINKFLKNNKADVLNQIKALNSGLIKNPK